jgi:FKBP-type peptidyl-prolyl cis-trans isomerase (trigger factor)
MKVEVKKVDTLKREVKFEVPRERVSKTMDEVYEQIGKYAKVRGFRPGKVPRAVLANSHGKLAEEETIKKLVPQAYQEGIGQHRLNPIDLPQISDVALKDGILSFKATLDIRPEVKPGNYKGIKVTRKSSKVSEEDIAKTLEFFKKGRDGAETVIDDAFARGMGFPNLADFKQALSRQLELDKDRQNRVDVENQIIDALIKNAKLVVPQSLVQRQLQHRLHETLKRLKDKGMKDEEIQKKEAEITASLQTMVERDVKVYLILEEIAKQEKIEASQEENLPAKVMEFLLKEAKWVSDLPTQITS